MTTDTRPVHDDENTPDYAGLTYSQIEAKHLRLRGTTDLRYPPNQHRCRLRCGLDDMRDGEGERQRISSHCCFLRSNHDGPCEWSSECGLSRFGKAVVQ